MSNRIEYNASTTLGRAISETITDLIKTRDRVNRIVGIANSMIYGNPPDYDKLEGEITSPAGAGAELMFLLVMAQQALNNIPDLGRLDRDKI